MKPERLALAFFHAEIDDVCARARRVFAARDISTIWEAPVGMSSLDAAIDQLPPRNGPPSGLFFTSPACSGWTGLGNRGDAWYTLVNAISEQAKDLEALFVACDLEKTQYPAAAFEFYRDGQSVRCVRASREEDGWHFVNRGTPLPFEDVSQYSRRAISDRLNRTTLETMLSRLDIDLNALLTGPLSTARLLTT